MQRDDLILKRVRYIKEMFNLPEEGIKRAWREDGEFASLLIWALGKGDWPRVLL